MIVSLYLVFINTVLMSLKYNYIAPTKYLQRQGHLNPVFFFFFVLFFFSSVQNLRKVKVTETRQRLKLCQFVTHN